MSDVKTPIGWNCTNCHTVSVATPDMNHRERLVCPILRICP